MSYDDDQQIRADDLVKPPGLIDQTILFENITGSTTPDGYLKFTPTTGITNPTLTPGNVLVNYRGLVNVISLKVYPFYIPKYVGWNNIITAYNNVITLQIRELGNNGWYGQQLAPSLRNGVLNFVSYQFQFQFHLVDEGYRYRLEPDIDEQNLNNLLQLTTSTLTLVFNTPIGPLQMPNPYLMTNVTYPPAAGTPYTTIFTTANGAAHNFNNNDVILVTNNNVPGVVPVVPYTINVISATQFTIEAGANIGGSQVNSVLIFNDTWQIRLPMRIRQIEKIGITSNRIIPTSS